MSADIIRVITSKGPVTLSRNNIVAINPAQNGTMITVESASDTPKVYISIEDYDQVVMAFLSP